MRSAGIVLLWVFRLENGPPMIRADSCERSCSERNARDYRNTKWYLNITTLDSGYNVCEWHGGAKPAIFCTTVLYQDDWENSQHEGGGEINSSSSQVLSKWNRKEFLCPQSSMKIDKVSFSGPWQRNSFVKCLRFFSLFLNGTSVHRIIVTYCHVV